MTHRYQFSAWIFICMICMACGNDRIPPGSTPGQPSANPVPQHTMKVETAGIRQVYEAVGTIRPLTESIIESQISAQILTVSPVPGRAVKKGQVLIELDARQLNARLKQARESLGVARRTLSQAQKGMDEARAGLDQAEAAWRRTRKLFDAGIVPSQKLEIDRSDFLKARARLEKSEEAEQGAGAAVRKAEEVVREAGIAVGYARITAPADGIVAERMADPGDLAVPGRPLLVLQTSGLLRLEAHIREGLISRIGIGQSYPVKIHTLETTIQSQIEEILPYADPESRTFLIKASLPATDGIYPGMFGRLLIPLEAEQTLLIPATAVRQVGQLELVWVKQADDWQSVYIKTGKSFGDKKEVLAGLSGNETIGYND